MSLPSRMRGPYRIVDRLGSGGMGEVLVAQREGDTRLCALKRIRDDAPPEMRVRLKREAHVATFLEHPNIASVLGAGDEDGTFCVATELIAGVTLEQLMYDVTVTGEAFELEVVAAIARDILSALDAAHTAKGPDGPLGVVHRDVAPKNVMVGFDGVVRLIDFGLVRASIDETKTRTGALMGTPAYIAPEQATGLALDHRADLYAAGLILFELLSSRRAVPDAPVPDMLRAAVLDEVPAPSSFRNGIGPDVDRVIAGMLDKTIQHRTGSAKEAADQFAAVMPVPAHRAAVAALVARFGGDARKQHDEWVASMQPADMDETQQEATRLQTLKTEPPPPRAWRRPKRRAPTGVAIALGMVAVTAAVAATVVYLVPPEPTPLPPVPTPSPAVVARQPEPPLPTPRPSAPARTEPQKSVRRRPTPPTRRKPTKTTAAPAPEPVETPKPTRSPYQRRFDEMRASYLESGKFPAERAEALVLELQAAAKGNDKAMAAARRAAGCLRSCENVSTMLTRVGAAVDATTPR